MISVIVAVYNVKKYLKKCVSSVLAQTYTDIEVILVDDGSDDGSGLICDEFADTDTRVRVIHKENGGLSSARNAGIAAAKGEYIGLIDGDDYIDEDMYELLYNDLIQADADMSICGVYDLYPGKAPEKKKPWKKVLDKKNAVRLAFEGERFSVNAVNKLYKRELFENVRYPEGKTTEDAFVILDLLLGCRRVVATTEQKYYYVHRAGSITTTVSPYNGLCCLEAYTDNYNRIVKLFPELEKAARMRLMFANFLALDGIILSHSEEEHREKETEIIKSLRKNTVFILFRRDFLITRKIAAIMLLISRSLYKKMVFIKGEQDEKNRHD